MAMTKLEKYAKDFVQRKLREQGYVTYAKIFDNFDFNLTKDPKVIGFMEPARGRIVMNQNIDIKAMSVVIRHEILHFYLNHERRLINKFAKKYGLDPENLTLKETKRIKKEIYKNKNFNIAADYEISNRGYTDEDKKQIRNIELNGKILSGLVTEDRHPDWVNWSMEDMYDAINKQKDDVKPPQDPQKGNDKSNGDSQDNDGDDNGDAPQIGDKGDPDFQKEENKKRRQTIKKETGKDVPDFDDDDDSDSSDSSSSDGSSDDSSDKDSSKSSKSSDSDSGDDDSDKDSEGDSSSSSSDDESDEESEQDSDSSSDSDSDDESDEDNSDEDDDSKSDGGSGDDEDSEDNDSESDDSSDEDESDEDDYDSEDEEDDDEDGDEPDRPQRYRDDEDSDDESEDDDYDDSDLDDEDESDTDSDDDFDSDEDDSDDEDDSEDDYDDEDDDFDDSDFDDEDEDNDSDSEDEEDDYDDSEDEDEDDDFDGDSDKDSDDEDDESEDDEESEDEDDDEDEKDDWYEKQSDEEKARLDNIERMFNDANLANELKKETEFQKIKSQINQRNVEAQKNAEKYKASPTGQLSKFKRDLKNFIANQIDEIEERSFARPNSRYAYRREIIKGKHNYEDENVPLVNVYFDHSASWDAAKIASGVEAISQLNSFVKAGELQLDVYYFGNRVSTNPNDTGGGTYGEPIMQHIKETNPTNVIVMTDSDIGAWGGVNGCQSFVEVPGAVWFLWKGGVSTDLQQHLKGSGRNTFNYDLG